MPAYHGASVRATLSVGSLTDNTKPVPLVEVPVPAADGSEGVQFVSATPFYIVEAGFPSSHLPTSSSDQPSLLDTLASQEDNPTAQDEAPLTPVDPEHGSDSQSAPFGLNKFLLGPKALSLRVDIGAAAYNRSVAETKTERAAENQDIKIDVFLNGRLAASEFKPFRYRHATSAQSNVFSGIRKERLREFVWILQPPDSRDYPKGKGNLAERGRAAEKALARWEEVNAGLLEEVLARRAANGGATPASAAFLEELARMKMPDAAVDMQPIATMLKSGVVDVVVTLGSGRKYSPANGFLEAPRRMDHVDAEAIEAAVGDADDASAGLLAAFVRKKASSLSRLSSQSEKLEADDEDQGSSLPKTRRHSFPDSKSRNSDVVGQDEKSRRDLVQQILDEHESSKPTAKHALVQARSESTSATQKPQLCAPSTADAESARFKALELAEHSIVTFGSAALIPPADNGQGRRRSMRTSRRASTDLEAVQPLLTRTAVAARHGYFVEEQVLVAMRFVVPPGAGYAYDEGGD